MPTPKPDEADLPTLPADGTSGDGVVVAGSSAEPRYGRFVSRGVIGQGGMGVVLRAYDPELDREVAIKVLTPGQLGSADSTGVARLQREAQAMAKLAHPNVVTVFEMGNAGRSRFIAMELVEGSTLRRWLTTPHTWQEVVAAFVACGRGLAAAHAAGLVHRDFKPENVLVGADGRPRVTDFGLVATGVTLDGSALGDAAVSGGLTVDGAVIGTPMYMAPEQWTAGDVDARTDQFAFCIALWEGVYGERPFAGRTANELRENVLGGKLSTPPRDKRAPAFVDAALRRGLSVDRGARWPSMDALLAVLDRPRRRRWPVVVAAVSVAVAAGVVGFVLLRGRGGGARETCPDPAPRLAGVWDASMAERVKAAFVAASPNIGADMSRRVVERLDAYAKEWRTATLGACRATHVEHTQSAQLLDERMVCLDRRLDELRGLSEALAGADRDRVNRSIDAAASLTAIESCADKESLLAFPMPTDPARRRRVIEVDKEIEAAAHMRFGDEIVERQAKAAAAVEAARQIGHLPLLVRALEEHFLAASINSDAAATKAALRELAQKAAEGQDDRRAAQAWIHLITLLSQQHEIAEAKALDPVAEAAVSRAGSLPGYRVGLLVSRGTRHMYAGELDESVAAFEASLTIADTRELRSSARQALAQVIYMRDGAAAALPILTKAREEIEEIYGRTHPRTADTWELASQMLLEIGDIEHAYDAAGRALAIREAVLPAVHRELGTSLHQLANVQVRRGHTKEARELYLRAISVLEQARKPSEAALTHAMLGGLIADEDGIAAARSHYEAGLSGLASTFGDESLQYIHMEASFAQRLIDADLCAEAQPHIDHAIAVLDRKKPRDLPLVLGAVFVCDLKAGRVDEGVAKLERARTLCAAPATACDFPEDIAFDLGKVLFESRRDRVRGRALVDEAARLAREHGATELLGDIETWQKAHR